MRRARGALSLGEAVWPAAGSGGRTGHETCGKHENKGKTGKKRPLSLASSRPSLKISVENGTKKKFVVLFVLGGRKFSESANFTLIFLEGGLIFLFSSLCVLRMRCIFHNVFHFFNLASHDK